MSVFGLRRCRGGVNDESWAMVCVMSACVVSLD